MTFSAGVIVLGRPFGYDPNMLGASLLAFNLAAIIVSVMLQFTEADRRTELALRQDELDFRETELLLDVQGMRADIARLHTAAEVARGSSDDERGEVATSVSVVSAGPSSSPRATLTRSSSHFVEFHSSNGRPRLLGQFRLSGGASAQLSFEVRCSNDDDGVPQPSG
jgi:hypothetical protein